MERTELEQWKAKEVARLLALVENERRYYQEMVAALPVALVVLSADRTVSSANRAFRQTFGLKLNDLRGKTIEQILPSERLVEKIRDAHSAGAMYSSLQIEHDGRMFDLVIVPFRNWEDETEVETLLLVEEVNGEAATVPKAKPASPETRIEVSIPAIVWEADADRLQFRSVRGDAEALLGFRPEHWTSASKFFEERIHPNDRAATMSFYHSALEHDGDASAEFRTVTQSGAAIWVRETIRVAGDVLTGVMTPIERRKQLEDQLLRSGRAEALQKTAAKLAHDLNNPLMIVTGYAEELRNALREGDPMRADVDQILAATERISAIASQLLNYTRKQANPASIVDVGALIARIEERIVQAAGEGCAIHVSGEPAWAMADESQLEEVISSLAAGNREDARERSHLTIGYGKDIVAEHAPGAALKPGTYAVIAIHDDGRGLDAAKTAAVFEGFLSKPGENGAGPALARAYAIVRDWGGDIAFFSEPFRGSTFLIYLPYVQPPAGGAAGEATKSAPVAEPAPAPAPEPMRETILLVEDEAGIRALVKKILRREHYRVLDAGSPEEAATVASSAAGRIDLLITDVMLSSASGRDLAERLREARKDLKVLYISGYTDDDAVRTGAIPPGSRFLQKPFTLGALVGKVKEALAG